MVVRKDVPYTYFLQKTEACFVDKFFLQQYREVMSVNETFTGYTGTSLHFDRTKGRYVSNDIPNFNIKLHNYRTTTDEMNTRLFVPDFEVFTSVSKL